MGNEISIEKVREIVEKIEHPEIAATFNELGMLGEVKMVGEGLVIEIQVPFPNIPIKEYLAGMIQSEILKAFPGTPISFNFTVMSDAVRSRFLALARSRWKGEI